MVSDIATATIKDDEPAEPAIADEAPARRARQRRRRFSLLTWRILAINVLALALLGGGLLLLGAYRQNLIDAELQSLKTQAQVFAAAVGEEASIDASGSGVELTAQRARDMMRRLVEPTKTRAQLLDGKGATIVDTAVLGSASSAVQIDALPPPERGNAFQRGVVEAYDWVMAHMPWVADAASVPAPNRSPTEDPAVQRAFAGDVAGAARGAGPRLTLTAAAPVQYYKQVLGVVLLSNDGAAIEQTVRSVRFAIIKLFGVALGLTVLLSIYLAGTIARPVRRLAAAAELVRRGHGRQVTIPDFTARGDEIGDLSGALRDMTGTLWLRMDAIERFAADVAHEIKNPLTSLRSAVETAARVTDPEKQRRLLAVILEDVTRLDRLITDISDASRLDAELSRDESATVPTARMLAALVDLYRDTAKASGPQLRLDLPEASASALPVIGTEDQLVRVFRNLIDNAVSFSPPGGMIVVSARRMDGVVRILVDDDGPGIPEGKLVAIFDRFYTERPPGEAFGKHSGLGLAISKQIVEAHHGAIWAENRYDLAGNLVGARFTVDLPSEGTER
jgi:two-component system, OmpR family, sensor histidine kinase ChvG